MPRTEIVVLLVVFAAIAGGIAWWMSPGADDELNVRFQTHIDRYLAASRAIESGEAGFGQPDFKLTPKLVAIDTRTKNLAPSHFLFPDDLRAEDPADVKSVVLVGCREEEAGSYGLFVDGYSVFCDVRVFDLEQQKTVWRGGISNSPPRRVRFPIPFMDIVADRPARGLVDMVIEGTQRN